MSNRPIIDVSYFILKLDLLKDYMFFKIYGYADNTTFE
jgi:hypothetical protein